MFRKLFFINKYVKYLYIFYIDIVVVVICNFVLKWSGVFKDKLKYIIDEVLKYVRDFYRESIVKYRYCYV